MKFDSRITPIKNNLASIRYQGLIKKKRFVKGKSFFVISTYSPLYAKKNSIELSSQLLFGEEFEVFEVANGLAWGQSKRDQYVGYTPLQNLSQKKIVAKHKVNALRTFIYSKPDIKTDPLTYLGFNSLVCVEKRKNYFCKIKGLGWCFANDLCHIKDIKFKISDLAIKYLNTPYLWGGRDSMGIDCSGLIQNIYQMVGINLPRDTDLQESFITNEVTSETKIKTGDLIFWKGHIAMALDNKRIIHANAFHMRTEIEPLKSAKTRIAKKYGKIVKIGRC